MPCPTQPQTVLIGFAEALAGPEAAWSLHDAGFDVVAFSRTGACPGLAKSRHVRVCPIPAPETSIEACIDAIGRLVEEVRPVAVLPLDDPSLYLIDHGLAEDDRTVMAGATADTARFALDKRYQIEMAKRAGFNVPRTWVIQRPEDAPQPPSFPCIIKPALAVVEAEGRLVDAGGAMCANPEEYQHALDGWDQTTPMLVQPILRGVGEGVFGLVDRHGQVCNATAHRRIRMMNPAGSGSSACRSIEPSPPMLEAAQVLTQSVHWRGLFMIEMLRTDAGERWFIEFNGRCWGSLSLARRMGLEYPAWSVQQALDQTFVVPSTPRRGEDVVCRHLGRELVHVLAVFRGPKSKALTHWPGRWATLRAVGAVNRRQRWYNWRRDDRRVFFADLFNTLREQVFSRLPIIGNRS